MSSLFELRHRYCKQRWALSSEQGSVPFTTRRQKTISPRGETFYRLLSIETIKNPYKDIEACSVIKV